MKEINCFCFLITVNSDYQSLKRKGYEEICWRGIKFHTVETEHKLYIAMKFQTLPIVN